MDAQFQADRVTLNLTPREYSFMYLAMSHVLHGESLADHDFQNILSMPRAKAENLFASLAAAEQAAQTAGTRWVGVLPEAD